MSEQRERNYVRSGPRALEMAREHCVERLGDCRGCLHALESLNWTCKIRQIPEVKQAIASRQAKPVSRRTPYAKLTAADAWAILDLLATGMQLKDIGTAMGVSATTVGDIRDGIRWRDVHRDWHAKHDKAAG